ncbi:DNA-3-methyladenine glycosylase I [Methanobrevibacter sp.]|uniref:DNA-3-methyladenine glycosylase I n=1 Tax=Methanobrevibacter sp. TaxID=66852 RepID=UPI00388ED789
MNRKRCDWVEGKEDIYINYHDEEWGIPKYDDDILFEMLILESFQAGLSWITILKKRESFREAFDNFNLDKIIDYDDAKVSELMENEKIIRNRGKIEATIANAKVFKDIQKECGSFSDYIWGFTDGEIIKAEYKTKSELSEKISKDLKKKGMKYVGPTTIYSYLESIGIIDNHTPECFMF